MRSYFIILLTLVQLIYGSLLGQCPDKDSLWKRIVFLRESTPKISFEEQLKDLLVAEKQTGFCKDNNDSTYALLLARIGVLFSVQSNYGEALRYTKKSIRIIQENAHRPSVNVTHLIRSYNNLRVYYKALSRTQEKMEAVDSCISIVLRTKSVDRFGFAAFKEKIDYLFYTGEYYSCIDYAENAEKLTGQYSSGGDSIENIIYFLTSKVNSYLLLNRFDVAEVMVLEKITDFRKKKIKNQVGSFYALLGRITDENKEYKKAISYYKEALKEYQRDSLYLQFAEVLNNIGFLHFRQLNQVDESLRYYHRALRYALNYSAEQSLESLNVLANIANAYCSKGQFDSGFHYFQLAFDRIQPGINETSLLTGPLMAGILSQNIGYLFALINDKADAYLQQFYDTKDKSALNKALTTYKTYDRLNDKLKDQQVQLDIKLYWRSHARHFYENAIEAAYLSGQPETAFYFFEKSRSVILQDGLNNQRWLNEDDLLQKANLERKILFFKRRMDTTQQSDKRYKGIGDSLFQLKRQFDESVAEIKRSNPLYYQSFVDSVVISIQDVRGHLLKEHVALVEMFTGDKSVYILVITKTQVYFKRIEKTHFEKLVASFKMQLVKNIISKEDFNSFLKVSGELFRLIFDDISLSPGRILISQDIHYFPFEALVTKTSGNQPTYFLQDYAVSYTYSARYLLNIFLTSNQTTDRNFIGFAPVNFSSTTALPSLRGSDNSLTLLKSYFNKADNFIFNDATRNNFMKEFYKYKIIQLYTHASDSSANGEPVIYFADSSLYLSDLIQENKPITQLIVLSACQTATGHIYKGEGIFSFNRGFAALGIPAAITNLWTVENTSTYRITELFYKYLANGEPTDVALQKAKLEFIKTSNQSLPFYWAAPVLTGKSDLIELKKSADWKWIVSGVFMILLIWFVWVKWLRPTRGSVLIT